jgi:hypothetical protein
LISTAPTATAGVNGSGRSWSSGIYATDTTTIASRPIITTATATGASNRGAGYAGGQSDSTGTTALSRIVTASATGTATTTATLVSRVRA